MKSQGEAAQARRAAGIMATDGVGHSRLLPSVALPRDPRLVVIASNARLARDVLHDGDGTLGDQRDWDRLGADGLARRAAGGVGGADEGRR
jgi:hypothetical protein